MNENAVISTATETTVTSSNIDTGNTNSRVTVNFFIPEGVDTTLLTLENYREVTGKRFRMTKDQKEVRNLSREDAFVESKALAVNQLGVN